MWLFALFVVLTLSYEVYRSSTCLDYGAQETTIEKCINPSFLFTVALGVITLLFLAGFIYFSAKVKKIGAQ